MENLLFIEMNQKISVDKLPLSSKKMLVIFFILSKINYIF